MKPVWFGIVMLVCGLFNTVFAHADVFDVYIAAGQSNMDGRGQSSQLTGSLSGYSPPQPDVLIHYTNPAGDGRESTFQAGWTPLAPGYSVPPGFAGGGGQLPSGTFGPEVSFGKAVHDQTTGRRVAIIKVSRGGTNLRWDWNPSSDPKGYMYEALQTALAQAMQALHANGHSAELRGVIWHQGESDNAAGQAAYEANLTNFIQNVRQDLGYPNLPFLIGELESVDGGREAVRTAQANVAAALPFAEFISSTGLDVSDGTHFTTASQIELGDRFAAAMLSTISNLPGDFNRDGLVDSHDYNVWVAFQGSTIDARADANNDGIVDHLDLAVWQQAVPEPASGVLAAIAIYTVGPRLRKQCRHRR